LLKKSGAMLLPAFIHRRKGPYHDLILEEPIRIGKEEDYIHVMERYNQLLEKHVRISPDQWFLMHKKWKLTPLKNVLVLDDGKKGHLTQSMAVTEGLKEYRQREGYDGKNTKIENAQIKFKSKPAKVIFNCISVFFSKRCRGCLKCMKWALDKDSYESLIRIYADVIISTGSTLYAINKLMSIENNARNVTVLDPGIIHRSKFNLVIIPKHDIGFADEKKLPANIISTDLALNSIDAGELDHLRRTLSVDSLDKAEKGTNLGLLIGGNNAFFEFSPVFTSELIQGLKKVISLGIITRLNLER